MSSLSTYSFYGPTHHCWLSISSKNHEKKSPILAEPSSSFLATGVAAPWHHILSYMVPPFYHPFLRSWLPMIGQQLERSKNSAKILCFLNLSYIFSSVGHQCRLSTIATFNHASPPTTRHLAVLPHPTRLDPTLPTFLPGLVKEQIKKKKDKDKKDKERK